MIEFAIQKESKKTRVRLGILKTPHGEVETPTMVPVATQATVKALASYEVARTGSQILIANTYHLHVRPGEKVVKSAGGLHKFMHWDRPLMTDSGGFQVFSLGFGKDHGTGKILKERRDVVVGEGAQPRLLKILDEGVLFRSYLDGHEIFLGPAESMKIQESLGADIVFAFDECTSPIASHEYAKVSLGRTHRWAAGCLAAKKSKQALFGIVQGGRFKDLRVESARAIGRMPFDGFGIGGEFGADKRIMTEMIEWVISGLPEEKPRHLLGIGHLDDIPKIIKAGVDLFDCIVPTHYARHGMAFTSRGRIDLKRAEFLKDKKPLDRVCACMVCASYSRSYLSHLMRAHEIAGLSLLTFHNLHFFNAYVAEIRDQIKKGNI